MTKINIEKLAARRDIAIQQGNLEGRSQDFVREEAQRASDVDRAIRCLPQTLAEAATIGESSCRVLCVKGNLIKKGVFNSAADIALELVTFGNRMELFSTTYDDLDSPSHKRLWEHLHDKGLNPHIEIPSEYAYMRDYYICALIPDYSEIRKSK